MGVSHAQARIQDSPPRTRASYCSDFSLFSLSGELHSLSIAPTTSQAIDVAISVASSVSFHLDKIESQIRIDYDYLTCLMNCRSQYTAFLNASSSGLRTSQELAHHVTFMRSFQPEHIPSGISVIQGANTTSSMPRISDIIYAPILNVQSSKATPFILALQKALS